MFSRFFCVSSALWLLSLITILPAQAQQPAVPLPTHPVRSISPADQDFSDLEFLRQEIGGARVVMLGEPTHGVGTATEAKIRLVRYLRERMGFTTLAFESGFFALDRAERDLQAGMPAAEAIGNSVFPVWTETREFQALLPLLGPGGLRVAGFDSQVGWGADGLMEELQEFLKSEKGAADLPYDYLDECISTMEEYSMFPPTQQYPLFAVQLNKARKLLEKVAVGPNQTRRERAAFWLQSLRSVQALAHDYATNDPTAKDSTTFKAPDSNPRDAQMADNLLWYLRQHPQEKVICWGALGHLIARTSNLANDELQGFRPMGQLVREALGPDQVYVLSTLAGGGTHGFGYWGRHRPVPMPTAGSVEATLLNQNAPYSFLSLKHAPAGPPLTTYALEFSPLTGDWRASVDGFLYLPTVTPPHAAVVTPVAEPTVAGPAPTPTRGLAATAAAARPGGGSRRGAGETVSLAGTVLDQKTGQPVPFATVAVPARSAGTIADVRGTFQLPVYPGETLQISCLGYEPTTLTAQAERAATIRLRPAAYALADVRVSAQSQDPRRIMKKVVAARARNYDLGEQLYQVYKSRHISNFDTVRLREELVFSLLVPAGFQQYVTFLRRQPYPEARTQEARFPVRPPASARFNWASALGNGMSLEKLDVMRLSPMFRGGGLRRYVFRLDTILHQGAETTYVLSFRAKKANKRTTGTTLQTGYQGRLFVQESDYAVTHYEALWQGDTAWYNAAAHKFLGTQGQGAHIFNALYDDWRNAHTLTYAKWTDGRYHLATSVGQARAVGREFVAGPFSYQSECAYHFQPLPAGVTPPTGSRGAPGATAQGLLLPEHPEFWQTYQRPVPAAPAPLLQATKP